MHIFVERHLLDIYDALATNTHNISRNVVTERRREISRRGREILMLSERTLRLRQKNPISTKKKLLFAIPLILFDPFPWSQLFNKSHQSRSLCFSFMATDPSQIISRQLAVVGAWMHAGHLHTFFCLYSSRSGNLDPNFGKCLGFKLPRSFV